MSEINARWQQDHNQMRRLCAYLGVLAVPLWPISYGASLIATSTGPGQWFTAVSIFTLLGAIGTTVGSLIAGAVVFTDDPPLEGANRP